MPKWWDPDDQVFVLVLVAAVISQTYTHKNVLGADGGCHDHTFGDGAERGETGNSAASPGAEPPDDHVLGEHGRVYQDGCTGGCQIRAECEPTDIKGSTGRTAVEAFAVAATDHHGSQFLARRRRSLESALAAEIGKFKSRAGARRYEFRTRSPAAATLNRLSPARLDRGSRCRR